MGAPGDARNHQKSIHGFSGCFWGGVQQAPRSNEASKHKCALPDFKRPPTPEAIRISPVRQNGDDQKSSNADATQFHASTADIAVEAPLGT